MTDDPVSVVVPYSPRFTPEAMFEEAKATVAAQTVATELVVVEDETRGPAGARNVGLDRADTRYVAFLDADDLWEPDKLARQLDAMAETGAGLCVESEPLSLDDFVYAVFVGDLTDVTSSVLVDTEQVSARFEESLSRGEDLLYVLEAATEAGVCCRPDLFTRRRHAESVTASGIAPEAYLEESKRFAHAVSERVPAAQPYLGIYYGQLYTDMGRLAHREGRYDRAVEYHLRALRIAPHPYTVWALLRAALGRLV